MNHTFTAFRAAVPLADLARGLMDEGFKLCPRDNAFVEFARLGKPSRYEPTQVIVIHRCGWVCVDGPAWQAAAALLARRCGGVEC